MRISDWSSDVCSSDLETGIVPFLPHPREPGIETSPRPEAGDPIGGAKQYSLRPGAELEHQDYRARPGFGEYARSEEHTSELQSLMRISYAVFCLKKKKLRQTKKDKSRRLTTRHDDEARSTE